MIKLTARQSKARQNQDSGLKTVLSVVASIGVPVTVVGALMFYFGWARANEQAHYMGLDVSLFDYNAQDYIMRSIDTIFLPLLVMAMIGLVGLGLHQAFQQWLEKPRLRPLLRTGGRIAIAAGMTVAAGWLVAALRYQPFAGPLVAPLVIAAGTAITWYGLWLARAATPASARRPTPLGLRVVRGALLGGIIALALFWELSAYAGVQGRERADRTALSVDWMPRVTALSPAPMGIDAPGVGEERIGLNPPLYRITGLRLLVRSGGRMFLVHDGWTPEAGRVIAVPDGDGVSWQFSR